MLPPFVAYGTDRMGEDGFEALAQKLRAHADDRDDSAALHRMQNGGEYEIPSMKLRPEHIRPGVSGFALHLRGEEFRGAAPAGIQDPDARLTA